MAGAEAAIAQAQPTDLQALGNSTLFLFLGLFLLFVGALTAIMWFGWWMTNRRGTPCPYTGRPLRRCSGLAFSAMTAVNTFLDSHNDVDNTPFDFNYAALSAETGRIFSSAISVFGVISVRWDFLERRFSGRWVSWGSLSDVEQEEVRAVHDSIEGFQTEHSSIRARPQDVDAFFGMLRPGPLYVDMSTKTLLGWKNVPGTSLEVLIVQRPRYEYEFGLEE